ncbi:MAG: GNAT family N-acetyltransferase [Motilibacteraceae bacterium]
MHIDQAGEDDATELSRLLCWMHVDAAPAEQTVADFAVELAQWWSAHRDSHAAFVARLSDTELAGMAWVAMLPRAPRPGATGRLGADIQSVFVLPQHRGQGIGAALVAAACDRAADAGAVTVTVQSSPRAVPLYERLGFESSPDLLQRPGRP